MEPNILGIDHPLVTVRDLDRACRVYERLGFRPAPRGRHPWGTANNLLMFSRDFIELIGVYDCSRLGQGTTADGSAFSAFIGDFLSRREQGVSLLALHSEDARRDHAAVEARGFKSKGLVDFRRAVSLPDGSKDEAVVTLSVLINEQHPNTSTFICQQHRPHVVWVPSWQNHPNKVDGILGVTYVANEPAVLRSYYRALFGPERLTQADGILTIATPNGKIEVIPSALLSSRYPESAAAIPPPYARPCAVAIRVNSTDSKAVIACLSANAVPYVQDADGVIRVAPEHACGVILEFSENRLKP